MRKKITYVSLIICVLFFAGNMSTVYAWFADYGEKDNYFSVGKNEVEIIEEFPDPEIVPDKFVKKQVKFTNTGTVPCYIRAKYYFSNDETVRYTQVEFGSEKWKQKEDGYFYYQDILQPGEKTEIFITGIQIKKDGILPEFFDLTVYTETIQSDQHKNVYEAFGKDEIQGGRQT